MRKSLQRLQMDFVDIVCTSRFRLSRPNRSVAEPKRISFLYVDAHRPDKHTPMEEVVRAFNHLIHTGQAIYWGTSEWSSEEIMDAWRIADKLSKPPSRTCSNLMRFSILTLSPDPL
jgi:aryl-alcohol dehydrogenase-like predicted oxidoreductase